MVDKFLQKSKKFFNGPQTSVLYAASVIMLMIVASRVLGLLRQRTLAHFFTADDLSLFFAAFRLPESLFEVLVFGTFSSVPNFLTNLESLRRPVKIDSLTISSTLTESGSSSLILALDGRTPYLGGVEEEQK